MKKIMKTSMGLLLGLSVLVGCTASHESGEKISGQCMPGVIGGSLAAKSDPLSKKVVMLLMATYNSKGQEEIHSCTGTPISEDVILTAAHCVKGYHKIAAVFANDVTCSSGYRINRDAVIASSFAYDPDYTDSTHIIITHDVGLVRLESKIPSDYEISPLYTGGPLSSDEVTLVGYGATSESGSGVMFLRSKKKSYEKDLSVSDDRVTILQTEGGLCKGDSGGPVFVEVNGQKQILGVASYVNGVASADSFCHGTSTAMYSPSLLPWITKTIPTLK